MSDDVANHTLALLRRMNEKIEGLDLSIGAVHADIRSILLRMTHLERAMNGIDGSVVEKQDQIDHLRHRIEAVEQHIGKTFDLPPAN